MKKIIFLLAPIFVACSVNAQENIIGVLEEVVDVELSKSTLFVNAQHFASVNEPLCTREIGLINDENGIITIQFAVKESGNEESLTKYISYIYKFNIGITCKDDKYKWEISNLYVYIGNIDVEIEYLSQSELSKFVQELESVEKLATSHFQRTVSWEIDDVVNVLLSNQNKIDDIKAQIISLAGLKKETKETKKLNYKIEKINKDNSILQESINRWNKIRDRIISELEKTMKKVNDF
jgi:predicted RNase H-like nuclease (RuvC/YqgF family)